LLLHLMNMEFYLGSSLTFFYLVCHKSFLICYYSTLNKQKKRFNYYKILSMAAKNEKLINVRETFDQFNLISALHSFLSIKDETFKNIMPPLVLLSEEKKKELIDKLKKLEFVSEKNLAA